MILIKGIDVSKYLITQPVIPQEKKFIGSDFIVTNLELELDNVTGIFYQTNKQGIFYPDNYYNSSVEIKDDDTLETIWRGVIRNVSTGINTASIECLASLVIATEKILIYTVANLTAPEHIFRILSSVIPQSQFNLESFSVASAYHIELGLLINLNYVIDDHISILSAAQSLAELALCNLYVVNDIIYLSQNKPYTNQSGIEITNSDIIANSLSDRYEDQNIINSYTVKSATLTASNSDSDSIDRYGQTLAFERDFSSGQIILQDNLTAMERLYDTLLTMFKDAKNRRQFDTFTTLKDLNLNTLVKIIDSERQISAIYQIFRRSLDIANNKMSFVCYNYQDIL